MGDDVRAGLQATITQSHIHFAQENVNGGIMVWLCGTGAPGTALAGPAGTQTCPQSGTISGTITTDDVVAIGGANAGQQIAAGEFAEFLAALKKELAYANIHTRIQRRRRDPRSDQAVVPPLDSGSPGPRSTGRVS